MPGFLWHHGAGRRGALLALLALLAGAFVAVQVVSAPPASAVSTSPTTIAAGTNHTCTITSGKAYCWGDNTNGELGNNTTISSATPVAVFTGGVLAGVTLTQITAGTNFSCALASTGTTYCWGLGTSGQLGDGFSLTSDVPVTVPGALNFTQITSGAAFSCGLTSAGVASCWGLGTNGQLGNGLGSTSNTPVTVSGGFNLAEIAAGGATACALSSTNVAYCWGAGASGQLGNGSSTASQLAPTAVTVSSALTGVTLNQVTVGTSFACALAGGTGLAYCWGSNANGQLGTATTPNNVPVAVTVAGTALSGVTLTQISAGGSTTCALAGGTGLAYCWGAGGSGQLGNGSTTASQGTAVAVTASGVLSGVTLTQVSAGASFACAVASKGTPNCWGANGSGQLGNPATAAAAAVFDVPVAVTSESTSIESGYLNGCMVRTGKGYCWGDDSFGELGNNVGTGQFPTPQAVLTSGVLSGVTLTQIASANNFTCALSSAGNAYCWGPGASGQLGNGLAAASNAPVAVTMGGNTFTQISTGTNFACALTTAGNAYCWGANADGQMGNGGVVTPQKTPTAVTMPGSTTFTQITAGNGYTCALTSTGGAYCWGLGTNGQLGQNTAASSTTPVAVTMPGSTAFTQITASHWNSTTGFSCAVSSKGAAYCWGLNSSGQLGDNTTTQRNLPTAVYTACGSPCSALNNKTVTQVTVGGAFACALDAAGAAYCWGLGTGDQLGNNAAASSNFPVAVYTAGVLAGGVVLTQIGSGQLATCAGDSVGNFYCWGTGTTGQLGNSTTTSSTVPVIVLPYPPTSVAASPGNTNATVYWVAPATLGTDTVTNYTVTLSPGGATCTVSTLTCTITGLTNGVTYTVTIVTNTNQGPSAPSTAATATPTPPGTITAGKNHSCTIFSGKAYCWGDNTNGELGNNAPSSTLQLTPVAVNTTGVLSGKTLTQIGTGTNFSCALDSTGHAYCWGLNSSGQLGDNTTTERDVPVAVNTAGALSGKTITQLSVGADFVCALDSAGVAYCWGYGQEGELGDNTPLANSSVPVLVNTAGVLAGKTITGISAGTEHTCALDSTGVAYCWGLNTHGGLGDNTSTERDVPVAVNTAGVLAGKTITQISAGNGFSCGLDNTGLAYCWGQGTKGELGNNTTVQSLVPVAVSTAGVLAGKTITQITATSNDHVCALDSTGAAYCWGNNTHGQVGNNTTTEQDVPVAVVTASTPMSGKTITQISAGFSTTCAMDSAGTAYCWGLSDHGQVGNNSTSQSLVPVFVAPQGPTAVAATPGDATAAISWTAPVFLNNGTVTGYAATAAPGAASCSTTSATSCGLTGLTDGTTYTVTVTVTASTGTAASAPATVEPIGFLQLTSPASLSWALTGNGFDRSTADGNSGDQQFTATDNTATGAGWHITVSVTTFTTGTKSLPNAGAADFTGSLSSAVATTAPTATCVGTCTLPTDTTTYPVVITTAVSSPTIYTVYDTSVSTGEGVMTIGGSSAANPIGWWVRVPATASAGTYTSTVTLEMISGP